MTKRSKLYYPKSSIKENLYTPGGEYMLENGTPYSGYYHSYDTGELFTNPTWDPINSFKLIPFVNITDSPFVGSTRKGRIKAFLKSELNLKQYTNPISKVNLPTQNDYVNGYYYRFFSVKRNEPSKMAEISKDMFLRSGGVGGLNPFLYKTGQIRWRLVGDEYDITGPNNIVVKRGVLDDNRREVLALEFEFPYIQTIFGDFRQFTIHSKSYRQ